MAGARLLGMMLASEHAIPAMIQTRGGAIVNISSISALRPRGLTPYTVSKGAVIALTRAMDIGHAALFLCSDEARYITGVTLPVDGGVTIASPAR